MCSLMSDCLFVSVCRSGLDGYSKNLDTFLSGLSKPSELESVCDALLCPQPHLSPYLQAAHA